MIGVGVSAYFGRRVRFYSNMIKFCEIMLSEITFLHTKLGNLIQTNIDRFNSPFKTVLEEFKQYLDHSKTIDDFIKTCQTQLVFLRPDERAVVSDFFKHLGEMDEEGESGNIKNYISEFKRIAENCEKDKSRFGGLFVKLGIAAGAVLVIILL
jgi:stage III sporulation protein AB